MRAAVKRVGATAIAPAGLLLMAGLVLAGALVLAGLLPFPGAASPASALPPFPPGETTTPQTDASVPASEVTMIGATPEEPGSPGAEETWGVGKADGKSALVRYYVHPGPRGEEGSWTPGPQLPEGFEPVNKGESPLFGEMMPKGTGVLAGEIEKRQELLVRKPDGAFEKTTPVATAAEGEVPKEGEEPKLLKEEALFGASRAPLIAPLEEEDGSAGALVVPVILHGGEKVVEGRVLHWDGSRWNSEPIEVPQASTESMRVLALGATSPTNAWLLAQLAPGHSYPVGAVALFRRVRKEAGWSWKPVSLTGGAGPEEIALTVPVQGTEPEPFKVPAGGGSVPTVTDQILTVTSEGVWIDGERGDIPPKSHERASATVFVKPAPEGAAAGSLLSSWCHLPPSAPAGTAQCPHALPEELPSGYSRSFAWANGTTYGERVITGLPEGVSLRLEGESFTRVLALGAGPASSEDPGGQRGAAFSEPTEGWLGATGLPVHLTRKPAPSELVPWPAPSHSPLLAIAPQPSAPVGALSSEALAVGSEGAVARFKPGEGWLPESLFGPGEQVERNVRLRAVAWPRPARAYAVGDYGQMWLWRAETDLWEKDPATPQNFRANLLGIAFDPENPSVGYAVGSSEVGDEGVLLRYGKTWTQEPICEAGTPQPCIPAQAADASFTSIAFAGSEAIVAYSKKVEVEGRTSVVGGLLVNDGSGWSVDQQAQEAIVEALGNAAPRVVAGLADGGAAFTAIGGRGASVFERQQAGAAWQATPVPLPNPSPGQLALFREGGALRALVTGGGTGAPTLQVSALPGSPPVLNPPIEPFSGGIEDAVLLRQTATGWSDESHEQDPVKQAEGGYVGQDLPYRPDSIMAVLVNAEGTQGWAVGGNLGGEHPEGLQTGDIERYPNDGSTPLGEGEASVPLSSEDVTFAVGGDAECMAPCAARARAGVGPQVWLTAALELARKTGVGAFFYTGPSITEGRVEGPRSLPLPYEREFERTASILTPEPPLASYVLASPQDRPEGESSERAFLSELGPRLGEGLAEPERMTCAGQAGCQAAYYALSLGEAKGRRTRMIALDESSRSVSATQQAWLEGQLEYAAQQGEPAVVVGSLNLNSYIVNHEQWAFEVGTALTWGSHACRAREAPCGASAYFYDAPKENVTAPLTGIGGPAGAEPVPTIGSGTLGYESVQAQLSGDFHGASGILLGQVEMGTYDPATNRARVSARLIPVIGELALEAKGGILLRRSEPALFEALARRQRAGSWALSGSNEPQESPYIRIPAECVGAGCQGAILPEYTFTSSNPEVGSFVRHNTAAAGQPNAVLQNANGEPVHDEPTAAEPIPKEESGLFCAYNAGTTIVTISAGGRSASLPVTVQPGSVREPCGTVPLKHRASAAAAASAPVPPTPAPTPAPASSPPASVAPVLPSPPAPPVPAVPAPQVRPSSPPPFFLPPVVAAPLLAFVPPPVPTPARPTPPTGTSAVTSPVEMAEHEEEEEEATESVSNQALVYQAPEHEPSPAYILGIVLLAAFAGASIGRRRRRDRRQARVAPATLSGIRSQARLASRVHPRR